jgi:hypothetical protein
LHAQAIPDADRATLNHPDVAARTLIDIIARALPQGRHEAVTA